MNPPNQTSRRNSPRIPVEFAVLAELCGHRVLMYSKNISRDGMFLRTSNFVTPHSVFGAQLWLMSDEEPIRVYLTSCFIERSPAEYGIGVNISGISSAARARWEKFYHDCAEAHAEQQSLNAPSRRTLRSRHIAVVGDVLNPPSLRALQAHGIELSQVGSASAAIKLVEARHTDAVICNLQGPSMDGLNLCYAVSSRQLPTRPVLLTDSAASMDFWMGAQAGAARVIAKPCSGPLLAARIMEVLEERIPHASESAAVENEMEDQVMGVYQLVNCPPDSAETQKGSIESDLSRKASGYLTQVYRYLSYRMTGGSGKAAECR